MVVTKSWLVLWWTATGAAAAAAAAPSANAGLRLMNGYSGTQPLVSASAVRAELTTVMDAALAAFKAEIASALDAKLTASLEASRKAARAEAEAVVAASVQEPLETAEATAADLRRQLEANLTTLRNDVDDFSRKTEEGLQNATAATSTALRNASNELRATLEASAVELADVRNASAALEASFEAKMEDLAARTAGVAKNASTLVVAAANWTLAKANERVRLLEDVARINTATLEDKVFRTERQLEHYALASSRLVDDHLNLTLFCDAAFDALQREQANLKHNVSANLTNQERSLRSVERNLTDLVSALARNATIERSNAVSRLDSQVAANFSDLRNVIGDAIENATALREDLQANWTSRHSAALEAQANATTVLLDAAAVRHREALETALNGTARRHREELEAQSNATVALESALNVTVFTVDAVAAARRADNAAFLANVTRIEDVLEDLTARVATVQSSFEAAVDSRANETRRTVMLELDGRLHVVDAVLNASLTAFETALSRILLPPPATSS